jgi:hypothetical protein
MRPALQRKVRAMSTAIAITASLAGAGVHAWLVRRHETAREPAPTPCAGVIDAVFEGDVSSTPDSVLLARLLENRRECMRDPVYVDQVRRLMLNTSRPDDATALLDDAERQGTFTADELTGQRAMVDLAAAHLAWTNDAQSRADELHAKAVAAADALRRRWPEWRLPYRILDEASRASWKNPSQQSAQYVQLERAALGRVTNGAFARSFSDLQATAFTFIVAALGLLALSAGVSGWLALRQMAALTTSPIGTAPLGYVELAGTLHLTSSASAVIGPHSRTPAVWYEVERRSGQKGTSATFERSAQPFLLRDATGDVVIEPQGLTVRTRHIDTKLSTGGVGSNRRTTERRLEDGDAAYAVGELVASPSGAGQRRLRAPADGRRYMVSNFSETELRWIERLWLWIGLSVFVIAAVVLAWALYQRYQVPTMPGTLL